MPIDRFVGQDLHHPGEVYFSPIQDYSPKRITSFTNEIDLSSIQAHSLAWKSFDDIEIEGILVYPQGYKKGQKVPLIASIHGGPSGTESEQFIGNGSWFGPYSPAVFASHGYATLVVNYRGSFGYGRKFSDLNYKDFGGGDFKDVLAGVDYLITQGIADPEQLFIRGHIYGGFMTAWAIGQTNRFKAAVVGAGIVDWISDSSTTDGETYMEGYFGGPYWENYALWRKASPLSYVENMSTPTLILQGLNDDRVHPAQANQLYQALKSKGVPVRLVFYPGERHGFRDPLNILDALEETLAWFKKYRKKD